MEEISVPAMECSIKKRLASEVEKAIQKTSEAHKAAKEAAEGKRDASLILLVEARRAEILAVKTLNSHRKEHRY